MATLGNIIQTYTQKGQAEDFEDAIYNVTPFETPVLSAIARMKAGGKNHKWQIDVLAAAAANAQVEGDDSPGLGAVTATAELNNYTQISRKVIGVSGTMEAVDKYGRTSEMAYQVAKAAKELKVDIDYAICQNQQGSAGATGAARTSGGMEAWIQTNQYATAGASTAGGWTSTGTIIASTDATTTTMTYTESALKSLLTTIWGNANGQPEMLVMSGKNKSLMSNASTFAGVATRFRDVNAGAQAQIISGVDIYVGDFGQMKIIPSRQVRDKTVLALNTEYWGVAYLRPYKVEDLAKTGDHVRKHLITEWTLVSKNEKASGKIPGLATA